MANEPNRDKVASLPAKRLTTATTTHPSTAQKAKALGDLIVKFRLTNGWQLLPPGDQVAMTGAWLEVLDISGVPVEQYGACYAAAIQARAQRKADGESLSHLTADELAAEWLKIKKLNDELNRQSVKMLAEVNPRSCLRCYGTGSEEMADGTSRAGCAHLPLDDDERRERDRLQQERIRFAREEARKIGAPKPPSREVPKPPPGLLFKCDSCGRDLNVLRDLEGSVCNNLLNRGTGEGELKLCGGTLKTAVLHACSFESCARFRRSLIALPGEVCKQCGEGLGVSC